MQEFKVGDKVLVEMEIICEGLGRCSLPCEGCPDYLLDVGKENLGKVATKKTYEDGMTEAWEMARRIIAKTDNGGLAGVELEQIFGMRYGDGGVEVFDDFTASEAAEKIKAWEEGKKFHVGDVVRHHGKECVVTKIFDSDPEKCYLLWEDGGTGTGAFSKFEKTGRTIDIAGILAEIGGAE